MSRITDVSSRLGEYMLKGYVLTDDGCPVCSIPMVRSPPGQRVERLCCVQCQATPDEHAPIPSAAVNRTVHLPSVTSVSSEGFSRVSTPPTEVSDSLNSPALFPPLNPQEVMRRRAQSDMASSEIGKRMLQGWAMLAEECPNDSCYGVPLIRPPKVNGREDPRKECVVCGLVYIYERDAHGINRLVPLQVPEFSSTSILPQNVATSIDTRTPTISAVPRAAVRNVPANIQTSGLPSIITTLRESSKSLEHSLRILADQLTLMSSQVPVDYMTIGDIAHSMEKVTEALRTVTDMQVQEDNKLVASRNKLPMAVASMPFTCDIMDESIYLEILLHVKHEALGRCRRSKRLSRNIIDVDQMRMPRFLQPLMRRNRGMQPDYVEDPVDNNTYYDQSDVSRSGSRWRNILAKRSRPNVEQRDVVYVDEAGGEYMAPPTDAPSHMARRPSSRRARVINGYSDSSITDSDILPERHPRQSLETLLGQEPPSQASFHHEPTHYMHRLPSQESFRHQESVPPPLDLEPLEPSPFTAPPSEAYMEGPTAPQIHETAPQYRETPPISQGTPRRFRARRGEPITIGGVRIEVEDDNRHRHRSRRSRSRSMDSYSSGSYRSYATSSSTEDPPIIISADPNTEIEIGNERDGFVPYGQYLDNQEARRRARRYRRRRTPEDEIYVVPAGANVIFVDEDGRELHRVGDFDDRYPGRSSRTRTTRQADGSYLIEL